MTAPKGSRDRRRGAAHFCLVEFRESMELTWFTATGGSQKERVSRGEQSKLAVRYIDGHLRLFGTRRHADVPVWSVRYVPLLISLPRVSVVSRRQTLLSNTTFLKALRFMNGSDLIHRRKAGYYDESRRFQELAFRTPGMAAADLTPLGELIINADRTMLEERGKRRPTERTEQERAMKQNESKSFPMGIGAVLLTELSHLEKAPYPRLTLMRPWCPGNGEEQPVPAQSLTITGSEVRQLYEALHAYYGSVQTVADGKAGHE